MTPGGDRQGRLVWLARHARAAADPPPGSTDHERVLTPRGRRDAAALGQHIGAGGLGFGAHELPAHVLCSTAARTTETAEALCVPLGLVPDRRPRLYYGTPDDVLTELRTMDDRCRSVMVVGHCPAVHLLATGLLSGETPSLSRLSSFPTCAVAIVRLAATSWQELAMGAGALAGFFAPPYPEG